MKAQLAPCGTVFILGDETDGGWSARYPLADLPAQLKFYRDLRDRRGGMFAQHYVGTVEALEALAREIAGRAA